MTQRVAMIAFIEIEDDDVVDPHNVAEAFLRQQLGTGVPCPVAAPRGPVTWRAALCDVVEIKRGLGAGLFTIAPTAQAFRMVDPFDRERRRS